jgi:chromosome segregation ATPase
MAPASARTGIRLEVRLPNTSPTAYEVGPGGFLVGGVPGCDLRLPGADLPPLACLICPALDGALVRRLSPVHPVALNGQAVTAARLADGDRLRVGPAEIVVRIETPPEAEALPPLVRQRLAEVEERERQLHEQAGQLEADRVLWYQRRADVEAECRRQGQVLQEVTRRLRDSEAELAGREEALARGTLELQARQEQIGRREAEIAGLQHELNEARQQLSQRYRERQGRLAVHQRALRRAGRKLQERKRHCDEREARLVAERQEYERRHAEEARQVEEWQRQRDLLDEQQRLLASQGQELQRELATRVRELEGREAEVARQARELEEGQRQYKEDLVRLDRLGAQIDQQKRQAEARAAELEQNYEQLRRDGRDLEEHARQLDAWHERLTAEVAGLELKKQEQESARAELAQRTAAVEGQQAMLASLRTRLERMREECRREEQTLSAQRARHAEEAEDVRLRRGEAERLRAELEAERQLFDQERRRFEERQATLEAAVAQLRQAREAITAEEAELRQRQEALDAAAADHAEQTAVLTARTTQVEELRGRLQADQARVRDREEALARSEVSLAALQEQVRRRAEELAEGLKGLEERQAESETRARELEARQEQFRQAQEEAARQAEEVHRELEARAQAMDGRVQEQTGREQELAQERARLDQQLQELRRQEQALADERALGAAEREQLQRWQEEAGALAGRLGEMEAKAESALERLARGREQLRQLLAELHTYSLQAREAVESARRQLHEEGERVQEARDEHRLAAAAFRHQVIEWQGLVGEMRETFRQDEDRLGRRRAEVARQAQRVEATSALLAQQAEELQEQERQVLERRGKVDRHLSDMQAWYRQKLRELAREDAPDEGAEQEAGEDGPERDILALTGDVAPGDRQLGDTLTALELVEPDTLLLLLREARRQRRSLRQLLLAGGYLTLYQMALIEAGNLDGLALGPVRVIDRVRATAHETAYRVFDPRTNREALLRLLAESEMDDAVRPDEFRQRFAAAAGVRHENVAATLELLEIAGRPAVLQEWLEGVPGGDWPGLSAAPGVWHRLLSQAARSLAAGHAMGLTHGRLRPASFLLTAKGTVKLLGLGEPEWLTEYGEEERPPPADDLTALGETALAWAQPADPPRGKAKTLPESLQQVLRRLRGEGDAPAYSSADELLEELDRATADVPANATAWQRFLQQARDQIATGPRRLSA